MFFIISSIICFLFVGHNLFLQNDNFYISLKNVSLFILADIYLLNFEINFINVLTNIKMQKNQKYSKKDFIALFAIMASIWILVGIGYYPGNITSDGVDQILQAIGYWPLNNSHPIIMALIMRILYGIYKSTFFVILVQIFFSSVVFSLIFYEAIKKGINKKYIYILDILFALMPNNYMMVTSIFKDIPYSFLIVLVSYYLYKIIDSKQHFINNKLNYFLFPIILITCTFYRHNGKGVLILTILALLMLAIKFKEKRILILVIESIILYTLVNNIIFPQFYKTEKNQQYISEFNMPVQRVVGNLYNHNLKVSSHSYDIVSRILSPEILGKYFNKYTNDSYYAEEVEIYKDNNKNKKNVTLFNLIEVYSECFFNYPYKTIKERTDATNIMWNVSMPHDSYNHNFVEGIWYPIKKVDNLDIDIYNIRNNEEAYVPDNIINKCFKFLRDKIMGFQFFDWFLWRTGIYLAIILLCSYIMLIQNKKGLYILYPMIGNTLTLIVSLSWQMYRYVYYIFLISIAYIIFTIICENKK